jgi:anti-anti-sigma factor
MQLKLATQTKDGILVVDCSGRIVFGEESSLLRETVKKAVSESNRIVLNLGEVNYIDSGGLGTLGGAPYERAKCRRHDQVNEPDQTRGRFAASYEIAHGFRCIQLRGGSHRILP